MSNVNAKHKISPSLESLLFEEGRAHIRDVIVLFRDKNRDNDIILPAQEGRSSLLQGLQAEIEPLREKIQDRYQDLWARRVTRQTTEHQSELTAAGGGTLPIGKVSVTKNTLMELANIDEVVAILPNPRLESIKPQDTAYDSPDNDEQQDGMTWGIKELQIDKIWKQGVTGQRSLVAVLDTGVYGSHQALKDRIQDFTIVDASGAILRMEGNSTFDADRHGTHVCGTICGTNPHNGVAIGVAPSAKLIVAAVLVGRTTLWTLITALDWSINKGARIINMSLGLKSFEPKLAELCDLIVNKYNVVPVAAIGNDGHGSTCSPGNAPKALAVGALAKGYRGRLSIPPYSSGGSLVLHPGGGASGTDRAFVTKPDIVAPGTRIYSCVPPEERYEGDYDYAYMNGTSMGAPHVSGIVALLLDAKPDAKAVDVIQALRNTADYQGYGRKPDNRWGRGVVRPEAALKKLTSKKQKA